MLLLLSNILIYKAFGRKLYKVAEECYAMDEIVKKYVLYNSVKYEKVDANSVIGKIIAENPELKKDIKNLIKKINEAIKEVSKLSLEQKNKILDDYSFKKKEEKRELELNNVHGKVVMRFAPNPNGPLHIGHARQVVLNSYFSDKYHGELILRFDDTDAKIKVPLKEAYKWIEDDIKWLGIKIDKIVKQSSRFDVYYKYAEELITQRNAYVCTCKNFKELVDKSIECPCRNLSFNEQLKRWKFMFSKYKEGDAVLRIKTDINDKNPAVRDWPAFRIIDKGKHPLKKAKVWPLLNFASAIDDHEFKVTHILRGIDLRISDDRQGYIYKYFNWGKYPETTYTGKLLFEDLKSTSQIKKLLDEKKLTGWDDVRLGTIMALRKRGFKPEAIKNFILSMGLNRNDVHVEISNLESFNKDIIDKESNRYFVVFNPKKVIIENASKFDIKIPLHPDFERGFRNFKTSGEFYVQDDIEKNKLYRFMHLFNFKDNKFVNKELDKNAKLIHWLPASKDLVNVEVLMNDNSTKKGVGESSLKKIKTGTVIQMERNFFAILEKKSKNKMVFVYAHR